MSQEQQAEAQIDPATKEVLKEIASAEAQSKVAKALRWIFRKIGLR